MSQRYFLFLEGLLPSQIDLSPVCQEELIQLPNLPKFPSFTPQEV